jgi:hypothetical protein
MSGWFKDYLKFLSAVAAAFAVAATGLAMLFRLGEYVGMALWLAVLLFVVGPIMFKRFH